MTCLILASASPRRQAMIRLFGLPVQVWPADVDETVQHPDPAVYVLQTARLKAEAITPQAPADAVIIAADTTVALDGHILGKPADPAEARAMLQQLRGRTHQVHTAIVVLNKANGRLVEEVATVDVPMRAYRDDEIEAYIATGDPFDKAGGYAIQHPTFRPVANLADCYAAVVGLPLCHLALALRQVGVPPAVDIAAACQAHHQYDCPVYTSILERDA
jgi:septum formation protein